MLTIITNNCLVLLLSYQDNQFYVKHVDLFIYTLTSYGEVMQDL